MTTTTIHDQHDTDERTAFTTPATTTVPIERPAVTGTSTSARTLARIAGGLAVVAAVSALSAAGYRAYVAAQAPVVPVVAAQAHAEVDGADAGPRSRHSVATSAYGVAVKADDTAGTTHGRVQNLPVRDAVVDDRAGTTHGRVQNLPQTEVVVAGTGTTSRILDDGQPPAHGGSGTGQFARGPQQAAPSTSGTLDALPQSRGTRIVG